MTAVEEFRATILARQAEAEAAFVLGDPTPRMALWSRQDPVTLLGALGPNKVGWDDLSFTFRWVATRLGESRITDFQWDIEVADVIGEMGYTVGYERFNASRNGGPVEQVTLRVTHIYRREHGEWKIVHRHGDFLPMDQSPAALALNE